MLKKIGVAAALALSLGIVPMAGHADPTNGCLATETSQGVGVATLGALTCTYTAQSAAGHIVQATPNHIDVTFEWLNPQTNEVETVSLYSQDTLTYPGEKNQTWNDARSVGQVITVTVGPDSPGFGEGAIGVVFAGDQ